jgi:hypothetical protein
MGATQISTRQIAAGGVNIDDLDITTTGKAVVTKLVAGTGVTFTQTGVDAGTGVVTINASGGGGVSSVAALTLGTTGTDLNSSVATATTTPVITLNVPDASVTARGVVTIAAQTFGGQKTFAGSVTASTALAAGTIISPTLLAAANSDVLIGLDINPTFTPGAFTTVTDWGLRVQKGGAWIITTTANDIAFQVSGTNGTLLQVTDTVTGNMLQVNNAAAAQIYAVDVTGAHYMASPTFTFSAVTTTQTLVSLPVAGLKSLFVDYYAQNSTTSAWRAGSMIVVTDGTNTKYTEYTTSDITAVTSGLVLSAAISATNLVVTGTITTGTWNIKLSVRTL